MSRIPSAMTKETKPSGMANMERHNEKLAVRARARAARMRRLRDKGKTLEEIGQKFGGISRQRVREILARPTE